MAPVARERQQYNLNTSGGNAKAAKYKLASPVDTLCAAAAAWQRKRPISAAAGMLGRNRPDLPQQSRQY